MVVVRIRFVGILVADACASLLPALRLQLVAFAEATVRPAARLFL